MIKQLLCIILKFMARAVLYRHRPIIIAITGSVGKTTTKEAIFKVVSRTYTAWQSQGNYNNEIGLPLSILGVDSGKRNPLAWLNVFLQFGRLMVGRGYPEVLVLEMGADQPGNIAYLAGIARPDIAVITRVGSAHGEFLGDTAAIQAEKSQLVRALGQDGIALLNVDDPQVLAMRSLHRGRTVGYGFADTADVRAASAVMLQDVTMQGDADKRLGVRIDLVYRSEHVLLTVYGLLGRPQVYALLAAYAVGRIMQIPRQQIVQSLSAFTPPPGRLRLLPGRNGSMLIDDTYNASPEAMLEALAALKRVRGRRRIAVLGDMRGLGAGQEAAHRRIGRLIRDFGVDVLVVVGSAAVWIADEALASGFAKTKIRRYKNVLESIPDMVGIIGEGDVVLIKGSQNEIRLEKLTEQLLAEPERAGELLVRQDATWKKKPV